MKKLYISILTPLLFLFCTGIKAQNALHFDGVDDEVDCGNHSSIDISGTNITLEAWIYAESWTTNIWEGNIINKEDNGASSNGYMLRVGDGGKLNFNFGNGGWNEQSTGIPVLSLNTWHHIAASYDGAHQRLYVDGQIIDSIPLVTSITSAIQNLHIGAHNNPGWNRYFHGKIDEVRIWNITRTNAQIAQYMNVELCGTEAGLMAYYKFNQGMAGGNNSSVTTLIDEQANNNGTLSGFMLSGSTSNWAAGNTTLGSSYIMSSVSDTICKNETYFFAGNNLSNGGVYTDTVAVASGCDSIIELTLIKDSLKATVMLTGNTLWSLDTSATSYIWVDCDNNYQAVSGANGQSFTPTVSSNYAVVVGSGNCMDTSACLSITVVSLAEQEALLFSSYPNPFREQLQLNFRDDQMRSEVKIYGMDGRIVWHQSNFDVPNVTINTEGWPVGIYNLTFTGSDQKYITQKIIKF